MQRLRVCAGHFAELGWESHVLCVDHRQIGREIDESLHETIPADLPITRVGAIPRLPGFSAIGLRALITLGSAGAKLLKTHKFDLVLVSTTAFPVMYLAARWARRYNVPYVLDFQDPWGVFPFEARQFLRQDPKSRMMQWLHRQLERPTIQGVGGLVAVNQRYVDSLQEHYDIDVPYLVQPFPYSELDFEVIARRNQVRTSGSVDRDDAINGVCLGRIPDSMGAQLRCLFALLRQSRSELGSSALSLRFTGTTYDASEQSCVSRLLEEFDLQSLVSESAQRISYLESLAEMKNADVLLLLGSSDTSYLPSKVTQYLASGRPIVLVADRTSQLYQQIGTYPGVLAIDSGRPPAAGFNLSADVADLVRTSDYGPRGALEAKVATTQLTKLFDQVICG